ncbi:PfkB family carbohydrate kinase [Actinoplanes sp. CA-030573]|uniref:PfkB family carbohydrate kinase n=1 Tax=Actinoplanes sp. CA-030573 TaxID=3239898 RepID=UPI003D8A007E
MTHILCAGLVTVDLVYRVSHIPGVDEKAQALGVEIAAGGPAANAAVTAAALGASVTLVTAVGAHPLGALIRADLARYGVELIDAAAGSDAPPPVSAITVLEGTGQRTIVSRNAGDLALSVPPLPAADLTLVDGHHPALAVEAARQARRLLVDAGTWRPVFASILPLAEVVAASAAFRHPAEASPTDEALAAAIGSPHVIVTHGPDPVRWFSGSRSGSIPVPPVEAVDTAGAGDAFHGALAVALLEADLPRPASLPPPSSAPLPPQPSLTPYSDKSDLSDCVAFAIRVAGVRVMHAGPRAWLAALPR